MKKSGADRKSLPFRQDDVEEEQRILKYGYEEERIIWGRVMKLG